jgi:hypothetical protein
MPTPEVAAAKYPHGTRARYFLGKCKCFKCKLANSEYATALSDAMRGPWQKQRLSPRVDAPRAAAGGKILCRFCSAPRTNWGITRHEHACKSNPHRGFAVGWIVVHRKSGEQNGPVYGTNAEAVAARDRLNKRDRPKPPNQYVPATKARKHLKALQKQGVGVKSIGRACGVAPSVLHRIFHGMIRRTRRSTEAKILAATVASAARGKAKIDGRETWAMLDKLVGSKLYTKRWIAKQLGQKTPALQMGKGPHGRAFVYASKAKAVKALYDGLVATDLRFVRYADPNGVRRRAEAAKRADVVADTTPAKVPLSKRDPKIAARWAQLTF